MITTSPRNSKIRNFQSAWQLPKNATGTPRHSKERVARVFFQGLEEVEKRRSPGTFASGEVLPRLLVSRLRPGTIAAAAGE